MSDHSSCDIQEGSSIVDRGLNITCLNQLTSEYDGGTRVYQVMEMELQGQRGSIKIKVCAFYAADNALVPSTRYGVLSTVLEVIPEHGTRRYP